MKPKLDMKLAIFETYKKEGHDLTGEATRQRAIIAMLGDNANPAERTRVGMAQLIAKKQGGAAWKNIYSGVFRDIQEILIPMELVEEEGRLPLKRGPKAVQEKGTPCYHLTKKGILVALSINECENREKLMAEFFSKSEPSEKEFEKILSSFLKTSPIFTYSIFQKYVKAFCENKIKELLPFNLSKLQDISDESMIIQKEILSAFAKLSKQEKDEVIAFLDKIT